MSLLPLQVSVESVVKQTFMFLNELCEVGQVIIQPKVLPVVDGAIKCKKKILQIYYFLILISFLETFH